MEDIYRILGMTFLELQQTREARDQYEQIAREQAEKIDEIEKELELERDVITRLRKDIEILKPDAPTNDTT